MGWWGVGRQDPREGWSQTGRGQRHEGQSGAAAGSDAEIPARKFNKGFGCVVLGIWVSRERQGGKTGVKEVWGKRSGDPEV